MSRTAFGAFILCPCPNGVLVTDEIRLFEQVEHPLLIASGPEGEEVGESHLRFTVRGVG
jgi:hypothetical protein